MNKKDCVADEVPVGANINTGINRHHSLPDSRAPHIVNCRSRFEFNRFRQGLSLFAERQIYCGHDAISV